jgi:hypothetical protein
MDLVTVTFNDDVFLCEYQLKSIRKFVEPCKIHIIVNEEDITFVQNFLHNEVSKLTKHSVVFWSRSKILGGINVNRSGWYTQQLLKLLLPIKEDYIVLDCKDIFVSAIGLLELSKEHYKNQSNVKKSPTWGNFYREVIIKLSETYPNRKLVQSQIKSIQTPRLIKKSIRKKIFDTWKDKNEFITWFLNIPMPSEFILYDILRLFNYENINAKKSFKDKDILTIWKEEEFYILSNEFKNTPNKTRKIVKLHQRVFKNQEIRNTLTTWLNTFLD